MWLDCAPGPAVEGLRKGRSIAGLPEASHVPCILGNPDHTPPGCWPDPWPEPGAMSGRVQLQPGAAGGVVAMPQGLMARAAKAVAPSTRGQMARGFLVSEGGDVWLGYRCLGGHQGGEMTLAVGGFKCRGRESGAGRVQFSRESSVRRYF